MTTVPISMNIIMRGQLRHMNEHFEVIGVTSADAKHFEACGTREGIRMHAINMARTISPLSDIVSLWKLIRFFRKEQPTIVHTHTPKAGLLGMLAAWLSQVPLRLHTVGGMPLIESKGMKRVLLNLAERITYRCAHRVYPNSFGLKNIITANKFCSEKKLRVLANGGSNGIDSEYFNPIHFSSVLREDLRTEFSISMDDIVFCFVGRIATEKGIRELVEAFAALRKDLPQRKMKLLLIGPFEATYGVLDEATRAAILQDDEIIKPGRFDDVRPFYFLSDVYVFPSYREGFPNTLLEAGAMGLPSIATDINGCNEIVNDQVNGLIIKPKDIQSLQNAMKHMVLDDGRRKAWAANARNFVVSKFSREVVWAAMLSEYRTLLQDTLKVSYALDKV